MNKKQTEEIARDLRTRRYKNLGLGLCDFKCRNCNNFCTEREYAKQLVEEGYHKTIWHKVADGDLPKKYKEVLLLGKDHNYYIGSYAKDEESFHTDIGFDMDKNKVIVWTELPKYEEQYEEDK